MCVFTSLTPFRVVFCAGSVYSPFGLFRRGWRFLHELALHCEGRLLFPRRSWFLFFFASPFVGQPLALPVWLANLCVDVNFPCSSCHLIYVRSQCDRSFMSVLSMGSLERRRQFFRRFALIVRVVIVIQFVIFGQYPFFNT